MKKGEFDKVIEAIAADPRELASFLAALSEKLKAPAPTTKAVEETIPLNIFSNPAITVLGALVLYLEQHRSLSPKSISVLLNRTEKSLWHIVHKARQHNIPAPQSEAARIPVSLFASDATTPLETLVVYCRETLGMKNKEIAAALSRDARTISSVYVHARGGGSA